MSKGPLCFNRLRVLAGKSISSPLIETIEEEAAIPDGGLDCHLVGWVELAGEGC